MQFDFIPRGCHISSKDLLADLRRVAGLLGRQSLTADAYLKLGRFVPSTSIRRFGGWKAALLKAGLTPVRLADIPAKDVLADIRRVAAELRTDQLTRVQYEQFGKYSRSVIYRHFQTWTNAAKPAADRPPLIPMCNWKSITSNPGAKAAKPSPRIFRHSARFATRERRICKANLLAHVY